MHNTLNDKKPKTEGQRFYKTIASYYDRIFPLKPESIEFVDRFVTPRSTVLDIGTATGEFPISLAPYVHKITGIDLNPDMIEIARNKAKNMSNVSFREQNMLNLTGYFDKGVFDLVTCFGNTIVHLLTFNEIRSFLKQVGELLTDNGTLVIQMLNYDMIWDKKLKQLPTLENDNIQFIREYEYQNGSQIITFNTTLLDNKSRRRIENSTKLRGIRYEEIKQLIYEAGLIALEKWGSLGGQKLKEDSLPLVLMIKKQPKV